MGQLVLDFKQSSSIMDKAWRIFALILLVEVHLVYPLINPTESPSDQWDTTTRYPTDRTTGYWYTTTGRPKTTEGRTTQRPGTTTRYPTGRTTTPDWSDDPTTAKPTPFPTLPTFTPTTTE